MIRPADATSVEVADVYKGESKVAELRRIDDGTEFRYLESYVEDGGRPIASTLPVRKRGYLARSGAVPAFFAGLLPEGARLTALTRAVKTSADDELSLLVAVGNDAVGDVRVIPAGERPTPHRLDLPTDPSRVVFADLFQRSIDPNTAQLDAAIAGVQDKLSDSMISFPIKRAEGRAFLKLEPGQFPHIVRNEHFFLGLAREAGFVVPRTELVTDRTGSDGLLIERFDRAVDSDGRLVRFAQEDGCQLLDRYPADKYRITINELAARVQEVASAPIPAVLDLVLLVAFSWAIGNGDLHAKNFSLQWLADEVLIAPTPTYDVLSTVPYGSLNQNMAMKLDGRDDNFQRRYFIDFAARFGVPERLLQRRLNTMFDRMIPGLDGLDSIGFEADMRTRLDREIRRRIGILRHGARRHEQ
ncbi:serine/threonine-protein kinase HipA [bacterium BMS3Bbin02]|nr:serine/threonine-protein kinase HipA [bacterium BMS3Bbin02]